MSGPAGERPTYRRLLGVREFRGLVLAQAASELGDQLARVAIAILVYERTDSAFFAVLAFVVSFVPAVFGSGLLAALADRFPRKTVMLSADAARAVVIGILALVAVDGTPVWALLGLLLVAEFFTAPFEAAHRSVVPDVLPDPRDCLAGFGLLRILHQVDQVVGLVAAGVVVELIGARSALAIDVVTFVLSFLVLAAMLRWRPGQPRQDGAAARFGLVSDFREGWHLVFDSPTRRALVVLAWSAAVLFVAPEAVALAYAAQDGASRAVGPLLMASLPAGAAVGAWAVSRLAPTRQVSLILPLALACAVPLLVTSVSPPWEVVLPVWFLSGVAQGFMVPLMTTVNLVSPAEMRGRVNGLAGAGFSLVTAVTFLASGAIADATSPAVAVTAGAVVGLALVGAAHRVWPRRELSRAARELYAEG